MIPPGGVADGATSTEEAEQVLPEKYKVMSVRARAKSTPRTRPSSPLPPCFIYIYICTRCVRTRRVKRVFAAICCDNGGMQMIVLKGVARRRGNRAVFQGVDAPRVTVRSPPSPSIYSSICKRIFVPESRSSPLVPFQARRVGD